MQSIQSAMFSMKLEFRNEFCKLAQREIVSSQRAQADAEYLPWTDVISSENSTEI